MYTYSAWPLTYAMGKTCVCTALFCVFTYSLLDLLLLIFQLNKSYINVSFKIVYSFY